MGYNMVTFGTFLVHIYSMHIREEYNKVNFISTVQKVAKFLKVQDIFISILLLVVLLLLIVVVDVEVPISSTLSIKMF